MVITHKNKEVLHLMKAEDMDRPKRRVPNTKPKKETKCPKKASNVHDPSQNYRKYLSNQYGPEIIIEWRKTEKNCSQTSTRIQPSNILMSMQRKETDSTRSQIEV